MCAVWQCDLYMIEPLRATKLSVVSTKCIKVQSSTCFTFQKGWRDFAVTAVWNKTLLLSSSLLLLCEGFSPPRKHSNFPKRYKCNRLQLKSILRILNFVKEKKVDKGKEKLLWYRRTHHKSWQIPTLPVPQNRAPVIRILGISLLIMEVGTCDV